MSLKPFIVRRRIAFRDCDPAGIVYTPRFFDPMATGAMDLFFMELIGGQGRRDPGLEELGTPAKAVEFVFHKGSPLGALIDITIFCKEVRQRTFVMGLEGGSAAGEPLFTGSLTVICVDRASFTSIPVPDLLRARLSEHLAEGTDA
ncbi:MAG: hypothetical protein MI723_19250 [Caulobacterales bacterium]|nr:hypothetical protein [Caulobacterales bacterium]